MTKYPIYDHLGMTEDAQAKLCAELFANDPALERHAARIKDQEEKLVDYDRRIQELLEKIRQLEIEQDDLSAKLRANETFRAETRGLIAGLKYHTRLSKERIQQALAAVEQRKKRLYLWEAQRRLRKLGRELKLSPGRPTPKGPPAPPQYENQEAS